MRHDAPYLVKRYAPMIGHPLGRPRVTVAFQTYTLASAVSWVYGEREHAAKCGWARPATLWIERRGQSAARRAAA